MEYLQRRSRHDLAVPSQEAFQGRLMFLAHFAEHPADGLVDEVFLVAEKKLGDAQRVGEVALPDEVMGRDDADAPFPHVRRTRPAARVARGSCPPDDHRQSLEPRHPPDPSC